MKPLSYFRAANRKSYQKHKANRLVKQKAYRQTPAGKATQARKDKKQQQINALHWAARNAVWRARERGDIRPPAYCVASMCQERHDLEAHHYAGYQKEHWLDVIYLCPKHHRMAHGYSLPKPVEVIGNIYSNPELLKN